MAAVILINPKNVNHPKLNQFFEVIDPYVTAQGWLPMEETMPRVYYTPSNVSPTKVRSLITTIKNTEGYNNIFKDITYSHNLTKG